MTTVAIVMERPKHLDVRRLPLPPVGDGQVLVDIEWSGISTGTERLLWNGEMPEFPGMGYPLVPGYESVGQVAEVGPNASLRVGDRVFVPGAACFGEIRGLFGGAASRLVVPESRVTRVDPELKEEAVLLALAATAQHALAGGDGRPAELIIGHGVLGRLLARLAVSAGADPVVWEVNPARRSGAVGYKVIDPTTDTRNDYRCIYDVSGDTALIEPLIRRLDKGGELVLAGFYSAPIQFAFPLAFSKELRLRVAAEWKPEDLTEVTARLTAGRLKLDGLVTHRMDFTQASVAYTTAFTDPSCLKMLIDWRKSR